MTTITAAISSVKIAADIAKLIKDSGTSLEQAEVKLKISELISTLADIKMELADVQTVLIEKDQSIMDLKNKLNIKESLVWSKPYYFLVDGKEKDGPFCQPCYDDKKRLIRLQGGVGGQWYCLICNKGFEDSNYISRPRRG